MKQIVIIISLICLVQMNTFGQTSRTNYSYIVLANNANLTTDKKIFEINDNILVHDKYTIVLYDSNCNISYSLTIPSNQEIEAVSIHNDLIYCGIRQGEEYYIKTFDIALKEQDSQNTKFRFSDFVKTNEGYFFYNGRIKNNEEAILFFTDNDLVHNKTFFTSSNKNPNIMIGTKSRICKKDDKSIYFNESGKGKIHELREDGQKSLIFNMGNNPDTTNDESEIDFDSLSKIARKAPIQMFAVSDDHIVYFSQKKGNYTYYYDRKNNSLEWHHTSIKYDEMDIFNFTSTAPSTFLRKKKKFAALLKGKDIHMVKEVVSPSSKTDHLPNCAKDDIILMTFEIDG